MYGDMTLPNKLTMLRLFVALLVFPLAVAGQQYVALILYWCGLVTDFLDGRIARAKKTTSAFGRSMDSFADKTLVAAVFLAVAWLRDSQLLHLLAGGNPLARGDDLGLLPEGQQLLTPAQRVAAVRLRLPGLQLVVGVGSDQ